MRAGSVLARACLCATLLGGAVLPGVSLASTTFGSDLRPTPNIVASCAPPCTIMNGVLPAGTLPVRSPVSGTIIRWRIRTGTHPNGPITIRVLAPAGGGSLIGAGTGDTETPPTSRISTYPARLPVRAGDYIGLDPQVFARLNALVKPRAGANLLVFMPPLADAGPPGFATYDNSNVELLLNADVASLPSSGVACVRPGRLEVAVASDPDPAVAPKAIHFRIDGGRERAAPSTGSPGRATIRVGAGSHSVEFWAEDTVGGIEARHHIQRVGGRSRCPALRLTRVGQSHAVWREGGGLPHSAVGRRAPVGTTFRFTLSKPAAVRLSFEQRLPGGGVKRRGALSFALVGKGAHRLRFEGRLSSRKRLPIGRYTVVITALDVAGHRAGASLTFTIV